MEQLMERDIVSKRFPGQHLAEVAYEAYGKTTDFKNYQGLPMPSFADLPEKIQMAWCNAALAIKGSVLRKTTAILKGGLGG